MKLKRAFWGWLLVGGILLWFGVLNLKPPSTLATDPQIGHVLDRLSFGPRPGDIESIQSIGIETYIQRQLYPESIQESPQLTRQLDRLTTRKKSPIALLRESDLFQPGKGKKPSREERRMAVQLGRKIRDEAIEVNLLRAIASSRQLQEVMVHFWFNHFNVFVNKEILLPFWIADYEQKLRDHALVNFRELLEATARHPAMLRYLDNWQNTAPNSPGARGRFKGLNENYARELMELHTLGVDGGYTQEDVVTLARILTGWGLARRPIQSTDGNEFYFDSDRHDSSDKVFLGKPIKGSGITEIEQALDILASHPATARHISYQLAQYFVADEPPASLVDKLARRFLATDGDIRAVLETLFHSPEFTDPKYHRTKFKTPYQYVISLVRATGINNPDVQKVARMLAQLEMPLYQCRTPDGYDNTQQAWLNSDATIRRVSLATLIARGNLGQEYPVDAKKLAKTLGNPFSQRTQTVIQSSRPQLRAALMLGSPEMMWR
jgi:uncharacterized protein (DUF1800 family)